MKFEVTISKRALVIVGLFFVIMGSFFVYAVTPNPGHDANMVGDGNGNEPFGGKSTFAGTATSWYAFPGHLGIGPQSIHRAYAAELFINSTDAWSGIGISSTGSINGDTYIDFMKNGTIGANINYRNGRLEFNAHPGAANTDAMLVTPAYFTVRGRDVTSAAAPGIRFSEIGSSNEWHIIKRGSQYATVAERDALLFSHWDGAAWMTPLKMNTTTVCIKGNCRTSWESTPEESLVAEVNDLTAGYTQVEQVIGTFSQYSFCSLSQQEIRENSPSYAGGGCYVYRDQATSEWKLRAYSQGFARVFCRALCSPM